MCLEMLVVYVLPCQWEEAGEERSGQAGLALRSGMRRRP